MIVVRVVPRALELQSPYFVYHSIGRIRHFLFAVAALTGRPIYLIHDAVERSQLSSEIDARRKRPMTAMFRTCFPNQ
jgi:hypothetical protein